MVEHLTFNQRVEGSNPSWLISYAGVAELADALDLGSSVFGRGGSSPFTRILLLVKRISNSAVEHYLAVSIFLLSTIGARSSIG